MEKEDFQKYLTERYENQIDWYDKKSMWNQKMYRYFQWSVIILATITPVLVAIAPEKTRWLTVTIAALVAIGTTILKTFKYQENWINYRTTCETLRKEIHFYKIRETPINKPNSSPRRPFINYIHNFIRISF